MISAFARALTRRRLLAGAVIIVAAAVLVAVVVSTQISPVRSSVPAYGAALTASTPRILLAPFPAGQTWYVCHGYRVGSHAGLADLDLVYSKSDAGATGCNDGAKSSTGKTIVAPATGNVSSVWRPDTKTGSICFNYDSGGSMMFSHLQGYPAAGARVAVGGKLGTVAGPVTGNTVPRNANVAHLHLTAFSGKDCLGSKVPFSTASNMRFSCGKDFTDDRQANQWFKEAVWACPTGELGGLNVQGACDRQYPSQGRTAKVTGAKDANSWRCVAKSGDQKPVDLTRECRYQFAAAAFAKARDARNPNSWYCAR